MGIFSRIGDIFIYRPRGITGKGIDTTRVRPAPASGPAAPGSESVVTPPPAEPGSGASQAAVEDGATPEPPAG